MARTKQTSRRPLNGVEMRRHGVGWIKMEQIRLRHHTASSNKHRHRPRKAHDTNKEGREWSTQRKEEEKEEEEAEESREKKDEGDSSATTVIATSSSSSSSYFPSTSPSTLTLITHDDNSSSTPLERPTKRQKRSKSPKLIASTAAVSSSSSSSASSRANSRSSRSGVVGTHIPNDTERALKQINVDGYGTSAEIIERFIRAAAKGEEMMIDKLDPHEIVNIIDQEDQSLQVPFIFALLMAHHIIDNGGGLAHELYEPYRQQLRSLIRRTQPDLVIHLDGVTTQCTLLHAVLYYFSINNTEHVGYDWLCGLLETPSYPIDAVDCHGISALMSWSRDGGIETGIVFHKLMQAGARTDVRDASGWTFLHHLFDMSMYEVIKSLFRYGYEACCLDALFQTSSLAQAHMAANEVTTLEVPVIPPVPASSTSTSTSSASCPSSTLPSAAPPSVQVVQLEAHYLHELDLVWQLTAPHDTIEELGESLDFSSRRVLGENKKLILEMRERWTKKFQPHIRAVLTDQRSVNMIPDCAEVCLKYLDGSGAAWK